MIWDSSDFVSVYYKTFVLILWGCFPDFLTTSSSPWDQYFFSDEINAIFRKRLKHFFNGLDNLSKMSILLVVEECSPLPVRGELKFKKWPGGCFYLLQAKRELKHRRSSISFSCTQNPIIEIYLALCYQGKQFFSFLFFNF